MTEDIFDFIEPIEADQFHKDYYHNSQIGHQVDFLSSESELHLEPYELVILGCHEYRGDQTSKDQINQLLKVREAFYGLENWHQNKLADLGNIKPGRKLQDTYAALSEVAQAIFATGAKLLIIGGSDDLNYALYRAYAQAHQIINISLVDYRVDFEDQKTINSENYVHSLLLDEPNYTGHLNVVAFQSYFVNPNLLEVLDNLRFDFIRLGRIKENIMLAEPMIRGSQIVGVDMKSMAHPYHQYGHLASPNGLDGSDVCTLMRFAGMSDASKLIGIFNISTSEERIENSALLIAQMIWYSLEGINIGKTEAPIADESSYLTFSVEASDRSFQFKKSKRTSRWWINLKDDQWIPCSYQDYLQASRDDIPERWLRAMEK